MSMSVVEVPVEVSGSMPNGAVIKLWEQIVPSSLGQPSSSRRYRTDNKAGRRTA